MASDNINVTRISKQQAIEIAAEAARQSDLHSAAHIVERLDGQHPYALVHFGQPGEPGAAVMLDALDGKVMACVSLVRVVEPWLISEERALEIANLSPPLDTRLVWKPCRATHSPFYPLWEISAASETVWVDQLERLWTELPPAGPG